METATDQRPQPSQLIAISPATKTRLLWLSKERNWAGIYSRFKRGCYDTGLIFDGSLEDCQEWLALIELPNLNSDQQDRFNQLSALSQACPLA